jgi:hypothetical protein
MVLSGSFIPILIVTKSGPQNIWWKLPKNVMQLKFPVAINLKKQWKSQCSSYLSYFVFWRLRIHISVQRRLFSLDFGGFPQFLQVNAGLVY